MAIVMKMLLGAAWWAAQLSNSRLLRLACLVLANCLGPPAACMLGLGLLDAPGGLINPYVVAGVLVWVLTVLSPRRDPIGTQATPPAEDPPVQPRHVTPLSDDFRLTI